MQSLGLQAVMYWEHEDRGEQEADRMKYTILAGNAELYEQMFVKNGVGAEQIDFSQVEWYRPENEEAAEDWFANAIQDSQTATPGDWD